MLNLKKGKQENAFMLIYLRIYLLEETGAIEYRPEVRDEFELEQHVRNLLEEYFCDDFDIEQLR